MSFSQAQDLIRLAQSAAARRGGLSLEEIALEFGAFHRTAERMTAALEEAFGNVLVEVGEDRKRRWRLIDPGLDRLQLRYETGWKPWRSPLAVQRPRVVCDMPGPWSSCARGRLLRV